MKHRFILILLLLTAVFSRAQMRMGGWEMHNAYGDVTRVENGRDKVYALSKGALMSVDKTDGTMEYYNKLTGLSSSNIAQIRYHSESGRLMIVYSDGNIDLLSDDGEILNINELYTSQTNENKTVSDIVFSGNTAYLAMDFGIIEIDLRRLELKDTYYIGQEASAVGVHHLALCSDSLYAVTDNALYSAAESQKKIDYHNWKQIDLPGSGSVGGLQAYNDTIYLLRDSTLYRLAPDGWKSLLVSHRFSRIRNLSNGFYTMAREGISIILADTINRTSKFFLGASDITYDAYTNAYWYAYGSSGVGVVYATDKTYDQFKPNGPVVNTSYRMTVEGGRLYVVQGGHRGVSLNRSAVVMTYDNGQWRNYTNGYFQTHLGEFSRDYSDIVGDPNDPSHFYVASFSNGLIEFKNDEFYHHYNAKNSPIIAIFGVDDNADLYTWIDGLALDPAGNLWMMNMNQAVTMRVLTADGKWYELNNEVSRGRFYVLQMIVSKKNPNQKIVVCYKDAPGIGIVDDGGTIAYQGDDKARFRSRFTDQNGKTVAPEFVFCAAEDLNGELWVGTSSGLFIIPDPSAFFNSDECRRVIIMRTDGSELGDYLLGEEQINSIAVDGANRKWIATQNSGIYLMSADGKETIEHFTSDNSPLPDNTVISVAVDNQSGMVYMGTGVGLVAYQSNASAAHEDFSEVYAYPNPVREDYDGVITIAGLMDNTTVKITDSAGFLVASTVSLGGVATWDGRDMSGRRVRTGVYMAQCVASEGKPYALTKILVVN